MSEIPTRNRHPTQDPHSTYLRRFLDTKRRFYATGLHADQQQTEVSR